MEINLEYFKQIQSHSLSNLIPKPSLSFLSIALKP